MNASGNIPVISKDSNIKLYAHQQDAYVKLSKWNTRTTGDPAGLLVLPTGGGKTLTATYWLMQNVLSKGKKVLWIAHRYSLLDQAYYSFEMVCHKNISSGNKTGYSYRIIFYFIIDEAHHAPARGYRNLIQDMRQYGGKFFMLGLTATPFRTDEKEKGLLKKVFPDDILYRTSISDLVIKGILSTPIFERKDTNLDMRQLFKDNNARDVYNRIIRDKKFDIDKNKRAANLIAKHYQRNTFIVQTYQKMPQNTEKLWSLHLIRLWQNCCINISKLKMSK